MRRSLRTISTPWVFAIGTLLAASAAGCSADTSDDDASSSEAAQSQGAWKVLNVQYQAQQTGYWCGPASTRIALSARISAPSQQTLANQIGTTRNGTDSITQVVGGLNRYLGNQYAARVLGVQRISAQQKQTLWEDVVRSVDNDFPLVVNIVAPPNNHPPGYPSYTVYHYVSAIGYNPANRQVYIADPARFKGIEKYWLSLDQLASLTAPKGYAYWVQQGTRCGGAAVVHGAIEQKYLSLGGCNSLLGAPISDEQKTPDEAGRYTVFQNGSIYWTEALGAHEVHGAIRDEWKETGWEAGFLGYPTTDELPTRGNDGRFNKFERGAIYYTEKTGTHSIHGRIYDKWGTTDFEKGPLGYPTSSEYADGSLRRNDFQGGAITWDPKTDVTTILSPDDQKPNDD